MVGRLVRLLRHGWTAAVCNCEAVVVVDFPQKSPVEESCIFRCYAKLSDRSPPCYIKCLMSL